MSSVTVAATKPVHHPYYYYRDGNLVIQTQDQVLFRLYGALFSQHSKMWEGCLGLPKPTLPPDTASDGGRPLSSSSEPLPEDSSARNGETDETAIFLRYNSDTFADFVSVLIAHPEADIGGGTRSTMSLVHILQMSHFFEAAFPRTFAIANLDARDDFSPALRLYCARAFDVEEWVSIGMEQIVYTPLARIKVEELKLLGTESVIIIQKVKERIAQHRRLCSCFIPKAVHVAYCYGAGNGLCDAGWAQSWWGEHNRPGVVRFLLMTDVPIRKIVAGLARLEAGLMGDSCRDATVEQLSLEAKHGGKLLIEETFVDEAVVEFKNLSVL